MTTEQMLLDRLINEIKAPLELRISQMKAEIETLTKTLQTERNTSAMHDKILKDLQTKMAAQDGPLSDLYQAVQTVIRSGRRIKIPNDQLHNLSKALLAAAPFIDVIPF